jgi:hypothetical protein
MIHAYRKAAMKLLLKPLLVCSGTLLLAFTAVLPARADYASTVAGLGPVAYYRLNTTNLVPTDPPAVNIGSAGTALNGQFQAMSQTRGIPGAIVGDTNTSVGIDGTLGQQVVVPYSAAYNPNGPFTVEFWAKPAVGSTASGNHTAAISMINGQNAANANDRSGWCVRHNATDWQFVLGFDYSDNATYYSTTMVAPGTAVENVWQHVVAVYTPSLMSIYINGALAVSQAPNKPLMPNFAAPLILGDRGYTGWDFIGGLDEVVIYTNALTDTEIKQHYDNGMNSARTTPYPNLVLQKNPALYFRLGEPSLQLPVAVNNGSYGQTYNGTYNAGTTPGLPALQMPAASGFETTNSAAGFNGTNGSVTIPGLPLYADTVTMVCWLKRDGVQPARAGIMHNRKVTAPEVKATGLGFLDDGLHLSYNWEDAGTAYNFNPGFVPPDQTWTFYAVAVSFDAQVMYMGTAAGLVAATNAFAISPHDFSGTTLEIGWDNYQATRVFKGEIDEFAMFDKTLTYAQISSLFNAALPAILSTSRTPADPVYEGMNVTFQTTVAGPTPITYQWRVGGVALPGKTNASLVLNGVTTASSGDYTVQVTSGGKTLTSPASHLTVLTSPPILTQVPASAVRFVNARMSFTSAAIGSQPLTYAWKHGDAVIPGATSPTLTLTDLQPTDAGQYTVIVSNPLGTNQATATLTLMTPSKYSAAVVDAAPVGYWRLDETNGLTAYDYWGGADATSSSLLVTNNMPGPRPATYAGFESTNRAYAFGGNAARVETPALNLNKNTVTIVGWINPHGTQVSYAGIIFSRGGSGTATGLDYNGTTGDLGYHWNDTAASYNWDSGLAPVPDQWNFVALVVEPTQATMYLDTGSGLQSSVNATTHAAAAFADPLRFGVDDPNGGRGFVGLIDEVAIYDHSLTPDQIAALRAAGFTGAYTPTPVSIVQQPRSQGILVGSSYTFTAKAAGSVPLTYQWQQNGHDLPGAVHASLSFTSAVETNTGTYQLFVSQGATKVSTQPATLTVNPTPAYINASNNLVLHLKFDGDYKDSSGRSNNGTNVGATTFSTGKVGTGALHYSTAAGVANYVSLGTPTDLAIGPAQNFSAAFWIKFTGSPGDLPFFGNTVNSYGDPGIDFAPSYNQGSWSWYISDQGSSAWQGLGLYSPVQNNLNDGQWHHLVHIFDRSFEAVTYLDGVKVNTTAISSGAGWDLNTPNEWEIGQAGGGFYAENGDFQIDDIGFWRRALTEYEAQGIYIVANQYGRSFDTEAPPTVTVTLGKPLLSGNNVTITWTPTSGTLYASPAVAGANVNWTSVGTGGSVTLPMTTTPRFFKVAP